MMDGWFETILQASTEHSIVGTGLDGTIEIWNEGARRLYGYEAAEVVGKANLDLVYTRPDSAMGKHEQMMQAARETGKWEGRVSRVRRDGSSFIASVAVTARKSESGEVTGYLLISKDVSDEVRLTDALSAAESRFRGLLENAPDAMVVVNDEGAMVLVNSRTETLFGYEREELLGKPVTMLVPRKLDSGAEQAYGVDSTGREFPVEISLSPIETMDGVLLSAAIRDVTERVRFEQVLRDKNDELQRASEAKDKFLASMSHELRTPLNAIIGFTGTLLMRLPGPLTPDQEKQLKTVRSSGRHLLSLINDLLDLAKIESGKVELLAVAVNCDEVLEDIAGTQGPQAELKNLRFTVHSPGPVVIHTDRRALHQILLNLTSNAVKFTEMGSVTLECREVEGGVEFSVSDTGPGISAASMQRLFQPFSQVSPATTRQEGTGLGLHLSRKLAHLLGGEITLESAVGEGSTFRLTLLKEMPDAR